MKEGLTYNEDMKVWQAPQHSNKGARRRSVVTQSLDEIALKVKRRSMKYMDSIAMVNSLYRHQHTEPSAEGRATCS
jgi:hypothetical protein